MPLGNTITVNTTTDLFDLTDATDCSLREAVAAGNLDLSGAGATIDLAASSTYDLTIGSLTKSSTSVIRRTPR